MSFSWSHYLNLAQELAEISGKPSNKEAKLRAALSRAYYAAFNIARDHLRYKEGRTIPADDAHWYIINQFKNSRDKIRVDIGFELDRLRRLRNRADYDSDFVLLPRQTQKAVKDAEKVISKLTRL